jgi:hypothetical protein
MALLFCDSFDHYTLAADKYEAVNGTCTITSLAARNGSSGMVAGTNWYVRKNLNVNAPTLVAGCAFKMQNAPGTGFCGLLGFADSGTVQVSARINSAGYLSLVKGGGPTIIGNNALPVTPYNNVWHYIELLVTFSTTTTGVATLRLDGQLIQTTTAVITAASANSSANQVLYGEMWGSGSCYIDDAYCCDATGSLAATTTFLGDIKVVQSPPTGQGTHAWAIGGSSPAATNWQSTTTEDVDVTYVSSATPGDRDHYTFPAISLTGTIFGVIMWCQARKDDVGVRQIAVTCTSAGSDLVGTTQTLSGGAAPGNYGYYPQIFQTDPHGSTSTAWTLSALNAADFGIDEIA